MRTYVGAGWYIHHLTDRVVELKKESAEYRSLTGLDGFVRTRLDPGMTRAEGLSIAMNKAVETDELLAKRITEQLIPKPSALAKYRMKLHELAPVFGTPEDEKYIGRKRV